ncbi:hypothetical protein TeGR_g1807, partial [Tetraparma gracilis]
NKPKKPGSGQGRVQGCPGGVLPPAASPPAPVPGRFRPPTLPVPPKDVATRSSFAPLRPGWERAASPEPPAEAGAGAGEDEAPAPPPGEEAPPPPSAPSLAQRRNAGGGRLLLLPHELLLDTLLYLRAYDLAALSQTCATLADPAIAHSVVTLASREVYPPELTRGYTSPAVSGLPSSSPRNTYRSMRAMELLVLTRLLSRPSPASGGEYYISHSWCKSALRWLDACAAPPPKGGPSGGGGKKARLRSRQLSNALPPWPNANAELLCEHAGLVRSGKPGAKRRVVDGRAWRVLRRLYPESKELPVGAGECLACVAERASAERTEKERVKKGREERRKVLESGFVRDVFNRKGGVPLHCVRAPPDEIENDEIENDAPALLCTPCKAPPPLELGSSPGCVADFPPFSPPPGERGQLEPPPLPAGFSLPGAGALLPVPDNLPPTPEAFRKVAGLALPVPENLPPTPDVFKAGLCPLSDGQYRLLPRSFLHAWRRFVKVGGERPAPPDSNALLCAAHGLVAAPPHLAAFLAGRAAGLFGGSDAELDARNASVVEVLTEAEYQALRGKIGGGGSGYVAGFDVRAGRARYGFKPCKACDAGGGGRGEVLQRTRARVREQRLIDAEY